MNAGDGRCARTPDTAAAPRSPAGGSTAPRAPGPGPGVSRAASGAHPRIDWTSRTVPITTKPPWM